MASSNTLKHNPNLTSQVKGWHYVGENVGVGGDVSSLHAAFMASAPHKANILDKDYTQIGVGVAMLVGPLAGPALGQLPFVEAPPGAAAGPATAPADSINGRPIVGDDPEYSR